MKRSTWKPINYDPTVDKFIVAVSKNVSMNPKRNCYVII